MTLQQASLCLACQRLPGPRALAHGRVRYSGTVISFVQHSEQESPHLQGIGRNASPYFGGKGWAFLVFSSCARIATCRLRHFSSEKRDGSPIRHLPNETFAIPGEDG